MNNELTKMDIQKMQEEIDYRSLVLRPKLLEDLATARAFGDLSENFEYKAAKLELRRCDSRLRYLKRMISTARVIQADEREGVVGLYDRVTIYYEDEDEEEVISIVTTVRQKAGMGLISKESPLGKAVLGKRTGDRAEVRINEHDGYFVVIRSIEKGTDDPSLPITSY